MATNTNLVSIAKAASGQRDSRALVLGEASKELVFAVVGHAGAGTSEIAKALQDLLGDASVCGEAFDVELLKARDVIAAWAAKNGRAVPPAARTLDYVRSLQDLGDAMRGTQTADGVCDYAAIARELALRIRVARAKRMGLSAEGTEPVVPDGKRRAYILDALRHPAEVDFLRRVYSEAFVLVGVVCEESKRLLRIEKKYSDAGEQAALRFMKRDAQAAEKHGQQVSKAFHLSDFFVDNTADRLRSDKRPNPEWTINEHLSRLLKIMTHSALVRATTAETAMYHAHGAQIRSACLSRQVGAALVDGNGNIVATGTNEVPRAGGGVYGQGFDGDSSDERCAWRTDGGQGCSNTREQNRIIQELIEEVPELNCLEPERKRGLAIELRGTGVGALLEFSRAVHAEMDALLSATRRGVPTIGTRMFVTTFPCHYCARHLVAAGVDEVQYIEPYPKSQALELHKDSIQIEATGWTPPSHKNTEQQAPKPKVWFHPFSGVAPRMYHRAFIKDRDLKDDLTGDVKFGSPAWGTQWDVRRISYVQLEAELAKDATNGK